MIDGRARPAKQASRRRRILVLKLCLAELGYQGMGTRNAELGDERYRPLYCGAAPVRPPARRAAHRRGLALLAMDSRLMVGTMHARSPRRDMWLVSAVLLVAASSAIASNILFIFDVPWVPYRMILRQGAEATAAMGVIWFVARYWAGQWLPWLLVAAGGCLVLSFALDTRAGETIIGRMTGLNVKQGSIAIEDSLADVAVFSVIIALVVLSVIATERTRDAEERESQRQRAVDQLRENETLFRTLAETTAAIIAFSRDDHLTYVNSAFESITGFSREEVLARPFWEFVHPVDRQRVRQYGTARRLGEPAPQRYEMRLLTRDGSQRVIDLQAARIVMAGQVMILATGFDVTDRTAQEEQLRQREAELAHVMRRSTMGELAAEMAHELSQPLCAITNYSQAAMRFLSGTERNGAAQAFECVNQVSSLADRAAQIVRGLRGFVEKSAPQQAPANITEIVREAVSLVELDFRRRGARLELDLDPALPPVVMDRIQIEQVVVNLLRNAVESYDDTECGDGVVAVRIVPRGENVEVTIEDHGCGLPAAMNDGQCEPFFTTKPGGMGMGLAISRTILANHEGRLWHERNSCGGTTAHFTLNRPHEGGPDVGQRDRVCRG